MMPVKDTFVPQCVKYGVYFMNFLFWVLGLFSVGVGLHVYIDELKPIQDILTDVSNPAVLIIALGILVFVAATVGCVGSNRENLDFLRIYALGILFLLLVHVAIGMVSCMVFFSSKPVKEGGEELFKSSLMKYKEDMNLALFINTAQLSLRCCGIHEGYRDWLNNEYYRCDANNLSPERCSVPPSCCRMYMGGSTDVMCGYGVTNDSVSLAEATKTIYTKGCIAKIEETMQSASLVLGVLAFGIAVPLMCGFLLAARMILGLQKKVEDYNKIYQQQPQKPLFPVMPNHYLYHAAEPKAATNVLRPPFGHL